MRLQLFVLLAFFNTCFSSISNHSSNKTITARDKSKRDLVIVIDLSVNSKDAVKEIRNGFANFISLYAYGGAIKTKYHYYLYTYEFDGPLQYEVVNSTNPDEVLEALGKVYTRPLTRCTDTWNPCCCSTGFNTFFPSIFLNHTGGMFFLVLDCFFNLSPADAATVSSHEIASDAIIYVIRLTNSYCVWQGDAWNKRNFGDLGFLMQTTNVDDAFTGLIIHHDAHQMYLQRQPYCTNCSFDFWIRDQMQAMGLLILEGKANRMPELYDPQGVRWSGNLHYVASDPSGATIIIVYADCDPNWSFYNGRCYYRQSRRLSFDDADAECRRQGASLLTQIQAKDAGVLDVNELWKEVEEEEKKGLLDAAESWIALEDFNQRHSFRWRLLMETIALEATNFTLWAPGQPLPAVLGARCAFISRFTGAWSTTFCKSLKASICSKPTYNPGDPNASKRYIPAGYWSMTIDSYTPTTIYQYEMI